MMSAEGCAQVGYTSHTKKRHGEYAFSKIIIENNINTKRIEIKEENGNKNITTTKKEYKLISML